MLSCFDTVPSCDGRTDRRTAGHLATASSLLYSARSVDDPMNEFVVAYAVLYHVHDFWQFERCPVGDVVQPLSSLSALTPGTRYQAKHNVYFERGVAGNETEIFQFARYDLSNYGSALTYTSQNLFVRNVVRIRDSHSLPWGKTLHFKSLSVATA